LAGAWPVWLVLIAAVAIAAVVYFAIALIITWADPDLLEWYVAHLPSFIGIMAIAICLYHMRRRVASTYRKLVRNKYFKRVEIEIDGEAVRCLHNGMSVHIPFRSIDHLFAGRRGLHLLVQDRVIVIPNSALDAQGLSRGDLVERLRGVVGQSKGQHELPPQGDR
jgi:hypothetical protein